MNRWLFKTDPDTYAWKDLVKAGQDTWDGVANPLALKHLRNVRKGDEILIYETGAVKAVVGTACALKDGYADPKDPKLAVCDLAPVKPLARPVTLAQVKADSALKDWELVRMARLSVMPVTEAQWRAVREMAGV